MKKYPFLEWGVAAVFLAAFMFSEFMVWTANEEMGRYWLHHSKTALIMIIILFLTSILFILAGEVETV